VENLTGWPRQITIQLADNFGSDSSTVIHRTSSGDAILDQNDRWFISNDQWDVSSLSHDPTLMVSWIHSANLPDPRLLEIPGSYNDRLRLYFVGTLAAGEIATVTVRRQLFESAAEAISQGRPVGGSNADLADLTVSAGPMNPPFQPAATEYYVFVHYRTKTFSVMPAVAMEGASVTVNGVPVVSGSYSPPTNLIVGDNAIVVRVVSPGADSIKEYVIHVERSVSSLQGWRFYWFGTIANVGVAADDFDFDKDGLPNLLEFAFGLDPKLGSSCQTPKGQWINGRLVFTIDSFRIEDIFYGAEWSSNMEPGGWNDIPDTSHDIFLHEFIVPDGVGPQVFVRFKVSSDGQ
jgi:hypothetical protein